MSAGVAVLLTGGVLLVLVVVALVRALAEMSQDLDEGAE